MGGGSSLAQHGSHRGLLSSDFQLFHGGCVQMDAWQQDQGLIQTGGGDRQPPEDSESDAAPQIVSQNLPTLPTPRPLPLAALLLVGFGILWMASRVASQSGHATASVAKMDGTPSVKHSLYEEEQSPCGTTQAPATQAPANPCSTTLAPASPCATTPKPGATGPGGAGPGGAGPGAPGPAGPGGPPGPSGGGKTRGATPEEDLKKNMTLAAKQLALTFADPTKGAEVEEKSSKCEIAGDITADCPITKMALKTSNIVYPGGKTVCINKDNVDGGDEYKFQVFPGATDKLLVYFQGGGGCFDEQTAMQMGACVPTAVPREAVGVFDQFNPSNPFKDFTIVQVLYCSGDMHGGDRDADMSGDFPISKPQKGYWNAKSAIDWTRANVPSPKILVVSGDSAGSLGTQVWARRLLNTWAGSYEHASVIGDSFFGHFPDKVHHLMFNLYRFCGGLFDKDDPVCQAPESGGQPEITIKEVFARTIIDFPNVNFGLISSKHDVIQMSYHDLVCAVACNPNNIIESVAECPLYITDSSRFYQETNVKFLRPYSQLENFVSYIVTGHQHTFTGIPIFYNTALTGPCPPDVEKSGCLRTSCDVPGLKIDILSGGVKECPYEPHPQDPPTSANLFEWFKTFPMSTDVAMDSCQQQSKCDGERKDPGEDGFVVPEGHGAAYCDERLDGVEHKCDEGPQTSMQCDPWAVWPDLDQPCTPSPPSREGECRAKVHTNGGIVVNGHGKFDNCNDYCGSFGHYCVYAAEDVSGLGCSLASEKSCFHHFWSTTSDMICGCAYQHPPGECLPPKDWDPDFLDHPCSDCKAKVHKKGDDGTHYRSCDMICEGFGHVCTHAGEDKTFGGTCEEKSTNYRCSDDIGSIEDTSDFICQCKYPEPTTTQPTTTVPTTQPTTTPAPTTNPVPDTVPGYTRLAGNCVTGHNIAQWTGKTPVECSELCSTVSGSVAFEYGMDYGGSPYKAGDCLCQDSTDWTGCDGNKVNLDLYLKDILGYTYVPKACVRSHNIKTFDGLTPSGCGAECDKQAGCRAFEYGADYGGSPYEPGVCILNDSSDTTDCDGEAVNLDVYIKTTRRLLHAEVPRPSLMV